MSHIEFARELRELSAGRVFVSSSNYIDLHVFSTFMTFSHFLIEAQHPYKEAL